MPAVGDRFEALRGEASGLVVDVDVDVDVDEAWPSMSVPELLTS